MMTSSLISLLIMFDAAAAACGPVKMDAHYTGDRIKFKNVSITYGVDNVVLDGLATGDLSTNCSFCSKQVFVQIFNKSSSSYVGVKQIRCDQGSVSSFDAFKVKYELPGALFKGHNFELRASDTWDYCETFNGDFDHANGYGTQHGKFAGIRCGAKPGPKPTLLKCPEVGGSTLCCMHKVSHDRKETCSDISKFYDTSELRVLHGDGETICSDKFAPPQPNEKLRVCPNYACAKDACIGGAENPKSSGNLSKIECALRCEPRPTRSCTEPQRDTTASESPNIGSFITSDPEECKKSCLSNSDCTAYNHIYAWAVPQCFLHGAPAVGGLPKYGQYSGTCTHAK